jgi:AraC-like DNA-binding protein
MEGFHAFELMARGGSLSLLALWSWLLVRDHWQALTARVAVAMNATIVCYLIVTAGWAEGPSAPGLILALGAGATPGMFWLFAKAWFNDETRLRRSDVALVALSVANALLLQLTFVEKPPIFYVSGIVFRIAMFAFAAAGLWAAWRGREGDLVEGRRRLRLRMIGAVGATVVLIGIVEIAVQQGGAPVWVNTLVGTGIVFLTFAFCATMFGVRQSDLFGPPSRAAGAPPAPGPDDALAAKLIAFMASDLPHRDETMTIAKLAGLLGEQEYRLRRTINGQLGHRNFAAFLNGYRLAEVKAALADPAQKDVSILTIALDAGFGSLGPFNRAFRDAEGMTPSAFRAKL